MKAYKNFYEEELVLLIKERENLMIEEENNGVSEETAEKIAKLDFKVEYLNEQIKFY